MSRQSWNEAQKIGMALSILRGERAICPIDGAQLKWINSKHAGGPSFSYMVHCPLCGNSLNTDTIFEKIKDASMKSNPNETHMNVRNTIDSVQKDERSIRVFISHSSEDVWCVKPLVELLKNALRLSSGEIRCTSLDGHRLRTGAETDEQIRKEVHDSSAFVGVISSQSIRSVYVIFELGARWGSEKKNAMFPIIAPGDTPAILGGPLKSINAMCGDNASQVHQFLEDIAECLSIECESPSTYQSYLNSLISAKSPYKQADVNDSNSVKPAFSKYENQILLLVKTTKSDILMLNGEEDRGIQIGGIQISKYEDIATHERYLSAINSLVEKGLIRKENEIIYRLTGAGWDLAESIDPLDA